MAGGNTLGHYISYYDAVGNRTALQDSDGVTVYAASTFSYDAANQLRNEFRSGTSGYNTTYTYDAAGNRLIEDDSGVLTSYLYNAGNQLLSEASGASFTTYLYDADGNRTQMQLDGTVTNYFWDDDNRLSGLVNPDSSRETYTYNVHGLRREKEDATGATLYLWDGQNLLGETSASLVTQAQYTNYPGAWGGLISQRRNNQTHYYGIDQQANVRMLVDDAVAKTDEYQFKAFGEQVLVNGSTPNAFRYGGEAGYYYDTVRKLYVRNREYDSRVTQWYSRDRIGVYQGDNNPYRYVGNNPVNWVDPSGKSRQR